MDKSDKEMWAGANKNKANLNNIVETEKGRQLSNVIIIIDCVDVTFNVYHFFNVSFVDDGCLYLKDFFQDCVVVYFVCILLFQYLRDFLTNV